MGRRQGRAIAFALLTYCMGCSSSETVCELTLAIDADETVSAAVAALEIKVYAAGAGEAEPPLEHTRKRLPVPAEGERFPAYIKLSSARAQAVIVVVDGLAADGERVAIEHKLESRFVQGQHKRAAIYLGAGCLDVLCESRELTCDPSLGADADACGPIRAGSTSVANYETADAGSLETDAGPSETDAGSALDAEVGSRAEAGAADASGPLEAALPVVDAAADAALPQGYVRCGAHGSCHPAYPCLENEAGGYSCAGQFAEWPIPNARPEGTYRPSYQLLADGKVTYDRVTGLFWQRQLPAMFAGCTGKVALAGDRCNWQEAKAYCEALRLEGRKWRLPGRVELLSMLDFTLFNYPKHLPMVDLEAFPLATGAGDSFWSSSPTQIDGPGLVPAHGAKEAWRMAILGYTTVEDVTKGFQVRCVSSTYDSPTTPAERYIVNLADNTVTDTRTALIWERRVPDATSTLQQAKARCAALGQGFRLPTAAELGSTSDPVHVVPSPPPAFVPASADVHLWTGDTSLDDTPVIMWEALGMIVTEQSGEEARTEANRTNLGVGNFTRRARCVR